MKKTLVLLAIIPALFLSGCVINFGTGISRDSGFFASQNRGEEWVQKTELMNIGEGRSFFNNSKPTFLKVDPQDPKALFVGSMAKGIFYTFNKGNSWQQTLTGKGVIHDIAIDPKDKCIIYAAAGNKVYKTQDCMRHWENIHIEGLPEQSIKAIAVDGYNNNKVYIGTSGGGLFKSLDYGVSWESIKWFNSTINKILINPKDTAKVYIATSKKGIYKSNNEGINWTDISNNITYKDKDGKEIKFDGADNYLDLEFDYSEEDALIYANSYGLFYTDDGGQEWEHIKLLTKPKAVTIRSVALNPNNNKEIYYMTPSTLYKSIDGGREWTTEELPTSKIPVDLLVDVENSSNLFMIAREIKN
jgi:photosystem II stability/assembly factor-like uncharacterized protein